jgi:predicted DNA-binding protein (UPF0251 family)
MFIYISSMKRGPTAPRTRSRGAYRQRQIDRPPRYNSYKPSGVPRKDLKQVVISLDEYEAFRLADYLQQDHLQASIQMKISRPTFTRLIEKARSGIARALVEGLELVIEGGNVNFAYGMHRCRNCGREHRHGIHEHLEDCPECGSVELEDLTSKFLTSHSETQRIPR